MPDDYCLLRLSAWRSLLLLLWCICWYTGALVASVTQAPWGGSTFTLVTTTWESYALCFWLPGWPYLRIG